MVTAGGGGGGGEKKEEGFGFIGGGNMKDWLIIMIVVVVGLMFLTHSAGVPGQKGPNGGAALFASTGKLLGMLVQWATFLIANPFILAFAVACRSETFRKNFPLPNKLFPGMNIHAFCEMYEELGTPSMDPLIWDPQRCAKIQAFASQLAVKKEELVRAANADKNIMKSDDARLLLSSSRELATLTPRLAQATSIKEFGEALEEAIKDKIISDTEDGQFGRLVTFCKGSSPLLGSKTSNKKLVNAVLAEKAYNSTENLANNGFATLKALQGKVTDQRISTGREMVAFLCQNPMYLEAIHKANNIPELVGRDKIPEVGWTWDGIVQIVTEKPNALNTIKENTEKKLIEIFGTGEIDHSQIKALSTAIGDLTHLELKSGVGLIEALTEKLKNTSPALAEEIESSAFSDLVASGLKGLGNKISDKTSSAISNALKDAARKA